MDVGIGAVLEWTETAQLRWSVAHGPGVVLNKFIHHTTKSHR